MVASKKSTKKPAKRSRLIKSSGRAKVREIGIPIKRREQIDFITGKYSREQLRRAVEGFCFSSRKDNCRLFKCELAEMLWNEAEKLGTDRMKTVIAGIYATSGIPV